MLFLPKISFEYMPITSFLDDNNAEICERYREEARQANSKPALASMLDINVCEWLCMMQPNHNSAAWLTEYFANFINGKWAKDCKGYTCSVYADYDGYVTLNDTVTAFVGCGWVRMTVPDNTILRVICSGGDFGVKEMGDNSKLVCYMTYDGDNTGLMYAPEYSDRIEVKELKTL